MEKCDCEKVSAFVCMEGKMSRIKTTFTLDEDVVAELETFSKGLSKKKSHIIETALSIYFDMMDSHLAEKILKDVESGKEELVDAEKVYKDRSQKRSLF